MPPRFRDRLLANGSVQRRLAHTESELAAMAKLCRLFATDLTNLREQVPDLAGRVGTLIGTVGALLAVAGVEPALIAAWVLQLGPEGLPEEAGAVTEEVIDQLLLLHGGSAGEA